MPHKFVELCCGGLMKAGKQVAASVECDCDGGVPETPGWAVQRISRLRQGVGLRAETRNEGRAAKPVPGLPIGAQGWRRRSRETAASARHPHAGCSRPSAVATRRRRRRTKHAAPRRRTQTFAPAPSGQRRCPPRTSDGSRRSCQEPPPSRLVMSHVDAVPAFSADIQRAFSGERPSVQTIHSVSPIRCLRRVCKTGTENTFRAAARLPSPLSSTKLNFSDLWRKPAAAPHPPNESNMPA